MEKEKKISKDKPVPDVKPTESEVTANKQPSPTGPMNAQGHSNTVKAENKFLTNPVWKTAFLMALPVVILQLVQSLYLIIDRTLASQLTTQVGGAYYQTGIDPAAATGLVGPTMMIVMAFLMLFNVGSSIIYSMYLAQKRYNEARHALSSSMMMSIYMSFAMIAFCAIFGPSISNFILGTNHNSEYGVTWSLAGDTLGSASYIFLMTYAIGFPIMMLLNSISSGLRSEGKTLVPSILVLVGLPINIFMAYVFLSPESSDFLFGLIHGQGLGTFGSAISTLVANTFVLVFLVVYTMVLKRKKLTNLFYSKADFKLDKKVLRVVATYGTPTTVNMLMFALTTFISTKAFMYIGTSPDSAFNYLSDLGVDSQVTMAGLQLNIVAVNPTATNVVGSDGNINMADPNVYGVVTINSTNGTLIPNVGIGPDANGDGIGDTPLYVSKDINAYTFSIASSDGIEDSAHWDAMSNFARVTLLNTNGAFSTILGVLRFSSMGVFMGSMTIVTMNYSAKQYGRAKSAIGFQLFLSLLILTIATITMLLLNSEVVGLVANTWETYDNPVIHLGNDSLSEPTLRFALNASENSIFREQITGGFSILLLSGFFISFSFGPYIAMNATRKRGSAVLYTMIRGIFMYIFIYWPMMLITTQNGNYELAYWTVTIVEFIFFIYSLTYLIRYVKHLDKPGFMMYDQKIFARWAAKGEAKTIPSAYDLEDMYLKAYGDSYKEKHTANKAILDSAKPKPFGMPGMTPPQGGQAPGTTPMPGQAPTTNPEVTKTEGVAKPKVVKTTPGKATTSKTSSAKPKTTTAKPDAAKTETKPKATSKTTTKK